MRYQLQFHNGGRRTGWQDAEVIDATATEATAEIERRSSSDGQDWRFHEAASETVADEPLPVAE